MISNTTSSSQVRYFIVQHCPDLFRREAKNVGVIVQRGNECRAQFVGETPDGHVDGRRLRAFNQPEVYQEWIRYWRRVVNGSPEKLSHDLVRPNGSHFNVIDAGFIEGAAGDPLEDVCRFTYSLLVSSGGLGEALGATGGSEDAELENLRQDVTGEFRRRGILGAADPLVVRKPVLVNRAFVGASKRTHTVSFAQSNGGWTIMEAINFATVQKTAAKDRAGLTAHIFEDIKRKLKSKVHPVAIVRCSDEDREHDVVKYSIGLLEDQCDRIIDWDIREQRRAFLEEREAIAKG